jgi:hypothetical protein
MVVRVARLIMKTNQQQANSTSELNKRTQQANSKQVVQEEQKSLKSDTCTNNKAPEPKEEVAKNLVNPLPPKSNICKGISNCSFIGEIVKKIPEIEVNTNSKEPCDGIVSTCNNVSRTKEYQIVLEINTNYISGEYIISGEQEKNGKEKLDKLNADLNTILNRGGIIEYVALSLKGTADNFSKDSKKHSVLDYSADVRRFGDYLEVKDVSVIVPDKEKSFNKNFIIDTKENKEVSNRELALLRALSMENLFETHIVYTTITSSTNNIKKYFQIEEVEGKGRQYRRGKLTIKIVHDQ